MTRREPIQHFDSQWIFSAFLLLGSFSTASFRSVPSLLVTLVSDAIEVGFIRFRKVIRNCYGHASRRNLFNKYLFCTTCLRQTLASYETAKDDDWTLSIQYRRACADGRLHIVMKDGDSRLLLLLIVKKNHFLEISHEIQEIVECLRLQSEYLCVSVCVIITEIEWKMGRNSVEHMFMSVPGSFNKFSRMN